VARGSFAVWVIWFDEASRLSLLWEGLVLNTSLAETVSVVLLLGVLAWAVIRPCGWPEAVVAVPAAAVVLGTGAISLDQARAVAERLGPVIGFLAAVLVLAQLCDDEGLFRACGAWMARAGEPSLGEASGLSALVSGAAQMSSIWRAMMSRKRLSVPRQIAQPVAVQSGPLPWPCQLSSSSQERFSSSQGVSWC
jgi:hypothetical protein